jgi:hypothetical protein
MGEDLDREVDFWHGVRKKALEEFQSLLSCLFGDCEEEEDEN